MSTETLLLVVVVCGIFGAVAAEYRRRTLLEGALLGLLLGPIGVLVVLLWPGPKKESEAVSPPAAPVD
jgi:hypothetical protein